MRYRYSNLKIVKKTAQVCVRRSGSKKLLLKPNLNYRKADIIYSYERCRDKMNVASKRVYSIMNIFKYRCFEDDTRVKFGTNLFKVTFLETRRSRMCFVKINCIFCLHSVFLRTEFKDWYRDNLRTTLTTEIHLRGDGYLLYNFQSILKYLCSLFLKNRITKIASKFCNSIS